MDRKERLMRQGLLVDRERERDAVETKIDRCVKDINYYSFPDDGIPSIDADAALQAATELKELKDRWTALTEKIRDLRERCGRG